MTEGGGCDTGVPVQTKPKRSAAALTETAEGMLAEAEVLMQSSKRLRKAAKKALCEAERATKPKASKCLVTGGVAPYGGHVGMREPELTAWMEKNSAQLTDSEN
jgi:hypothetical protein